MELLEYALTNISKLWPGKPVDDIGGGPSRRGRHAGYMASKKRNKVPTVIANPRKVSTHNDNKSGRRNSAPALIKASQSPSKDEDKPKINKKTKKSRPVIFNPKDLENLTVQSGTHPSQRLVHEEDQLFDADARSGDGLIFPADRFADIIATSARSNPSSADEIRTSRNRMGNFGSLLTGGDGDELGPDLKPYRVQENSLEHSLKQNCNLNGNFEKILPTKWSEVLVTVFPTKLRAC